MERPARAPTALIGAYEPAPGPGGLRALVPLAGTTLLEHQLRRALAAGARRVLLLVDEVPPALADMLGAMRRDGVAVAPVMGLDAAADMLAPDEAVLLLADGCLADPIMIGRLALAPLPALATLIDGPGMQRHERIDATTRWAGLALIDTRRVGDAAAMVGTWDPVSTLLRRAVQEGAARVAMDARPPLLALDDETIVAAERVIVLSARLAPRDWIERWLFLPLTDLILPRLMARRIRADLPALAGVALALGGGALALVGWRRAALLLLLLAGPLAFAAERLARVGDRPIAWARPLRLVRRGGGALALLGLAGLLARASGQWGWWLVAALLPAAMFIRARLARAVLETPPLWLASDDALIWTMPPFAVFGWWGGGVVAAVGYAAASATFVTWRLLRQTEGD